MVFFVWYSDYGFIGLDRQLAGDAPSTWPSLSAVSNRVSHSFGFTGPSHAVDAMCASSLVSLHLACNSLRDGECDLALAGGVNLSLHPQKYLMLKERRFLSSDGRCRSFGAGGDGYVPAEGVGAVLLKRLGDALADGDNIHGVILGSACNHAGKTSGFTVPNPRIQAAVIEDALARARVDPRAVSYIEAHGAGTGLGDPIEIAGLTAALQSGDEAAAQPPCVIGSVKSNIGHCEAAAGIAGLLKVLLQLRHREIVGSLHAERVNEHIAFEETRFRLQRACTPWPRPVGEAVLEAAGVPREEPRIAGISSFGAGGSNAHVVIREHLPEEASVAAPAPHAIVLSAKSEDRLRAAAGNLLAFLDEAAGPAAGLDAIAYTLQTGREAMAVRLGLVADSRDDLIGKLTRFLDGGAVAREILLGRVRPAEAEESLNASQDLGGLIETGQLAQLLAHWVTGASVPWERLYRGRPPRRISLPTYPFQDDRYWLPEPESGAEPYSAVAARPEALDRAYRDCLRRIDTRALDAQALARELASLEFPE